MIPMAIELTRKNSATKKLKNNPIPSIQITLTTFIDDENGEISSASGVVKIDGEEDSPKQLILDRSLFKSFVVRNLLILSFGQFLLFMAFDSLSSLQSTINAEGDVGPVSLAVVYGVFAVSSFLLPTVLIKSLGCKKTLVLGTLSVLPYVLGNFYPAWPMLIPAAFICGLGLGPLWSARNSYLNQISHRYARLHKISADITGAWFFSICTLFHLNTEIWGNVLSYYVLKIADDHYSNLPKEFVLENCGPSFCDDGTLSSSAHFPLRSDARRYVLTTIFTALTLVATFFTAFFLEPLEWADMDERDAQTFSLTDFLAAFHQFPKFDQILLLPLSLYTGLIDGFYNGDYRKAYVSCAWGVPQMGAASICYGVVGALVDSACGPCVQVLGRAGLFLLASAAHFSMLLALLLWRPAGSQAAGFFLVAGAHGIGNGVWRSQIPALYGVLFKEKEEAAFSCFYFLHSLGYLLAFSYSNYLCTYVKLFIPLVALLVGLVCYFALEIRLVKKTLPEYGRRA